MKFKSSSPKHTKKIARFLSKSLYDNFPAKKTIVLGLIGELGSGKTTFVQELGKYFKIKKKITSPTFLIIKNYNLNHIFFKKFFHIDAYRIKTPKELDVLDFKKILKNKKNIILIEWADKIKKILPKNTIWINFEHGKTKNERIIRISRFFPDKNLNGFDKRD